MRTNTAQVPLTTASLDNAASIAQSVKSGKSILKQVRLNNELPRGLDA